MSCFFSPLQFTLLFIKNKCVNTDMSLLFSRSTLFDASHKSEFTSQLFKFQAVSFTLRRNVCQCYETANDLCCVPYIYDAHVVRESLCLYEFMRQKRREALIVCCVLLHYDNISFQLYHIHVIAAGYI